jgi:hypothetical protein
MSPTILKEGSYRFYFNSNEETRMHIHVESDNGKAKFWLEPDIELSFYKDFRQYEINEILKVIRSHQQEFEDAWHKHFYR